MAKNKSYDEGSIMDLAVKALQPIQDLFESDKPTDKLLGLSMALVFIILGLSISYFLNPNFNDLSGIVIVIISFIFSAVILGAYGHFIQLFRKIYKVRALSYGISILLVGIPLGLIGLLYNMKILINLSLLAIFLQTLIIIVFSGFVSDTGIDLKSGLGIFGKINLIIGAISSIITIGTFILKFI